MKFSVAASLIISQFAFSDALTISIPSIPAISNGPFLNHFESQEKSNQVDNHTVGADSNCNFTSIAEVSSAVSQNASVNASSAVVQSTTVSVTSSASSSIIETSSSAVSTGTSTLQSTTGRGTFYQPSNDACGTTSSAEDMIVAISQQLYESNSLSGEYISGYCGKYITANYEGKSVKVKVVDACASCSLNDLDFSPAAFQKLADPEIGVIQVTWSWD